MKPSEVYERLMRLVELGVVRDDLVVSSPDGRRRYSLTADGRERVYSRPEVLAFIHGAEAGLRRQHGDGR